MRASNDFFVVGMAGIGTALFLTQLLIVGQQIAAANNHIQAELAAEKTAVPIKWVNSVRPPPPISEHTFTLPWEFPPEPGERWGIAHSTRQFPPVYPPLALQRHIGGFVDFLVTIRPDGSVADSKIVSEAPEGYGFAAAAAEVLPKWRFEPGLTTSKSGLTTRLFRVTFKPDN